MTTLPHATFRRRFYRVDPVCACTRRRRYVFGDFIAKV